MIGIHSVLIHDVAAQRGDEIRATAARQRLVREVGREHGVRTATERLRGLVGNALVGAGTLLAGRRTERPVGAGRVADAAVLRMSR